LRADLGGGTLYDIGIYCINAARYLFQDEPLEVSAVSVRDTSQRFHEVEEMTSAVMQFPGDRLATFTCSFGANDVSTYQIVGTKGTLRLEPAYDLASTLKYQLTIQGKTKERSFPKRDQFAPELLYFSDCILDGRDPEPDGVEGLADVRIIHALYRSAEIGKPVSLSPIERSWRPSLAQEIRRPAVLRPRLVHAAPPSAE